MTTASDEHLARVSGEVELCWQDFGDPDGPPMLMIMGLGAQMILWPDELCELLGDKGFRVIRFDNRDAGRSTWLEDYPTPPVPEVLRDGAPPGAYTLSDMAGDAGGLLDALEIEAAHVVGASLGGMIAQTLAIERPHRVVSLASIMSTTGESGVGMPSEAGLRGLTTVPPRERDGYIDAIVGARKLIGSPGFPFDEERARRIAALGWDRGYNPKGTVRQTIAIISGQSRAEALRELDMPTVVIHGTDDPLIDVSGGQATASAIPGARLLLIEGMGHDFPAGVWRHTADAIAANAVRAG